MEKQQKSNKEVPLCFQIKVRESLKDLLALLKLHSACVNCLPERKAFDHHVAWVIRRIATVDYHLQQVHAYLLTMSRVKKSDVPAFHVSSGMGHDALVMTTTAKDRLVSVFSSTEWPTEIIYHRREVAVVGMQWSYKIAVKLKSSENYRTPTRLWETVIIIVFVAYTKSIHSTMPCTHSPDWYLPYLHLGISLCCMRRASHQRISWGLLYYRFL